MNAIFLEFTRSSLASFSNSTGDKPCIAAVKAGIAATTFSDRSFSVSSPVSSSDPRRAITPPRIGDNTLLNWAVILAAVKTGNGEIKNDIPSI